MKRWKLILSLLGILLGLGLLAYWDEKKSEIDELKEKDEKRPIKFEIDDVVEFLFESPATSTKISLVKVGGDWRFKEDNQLKANGESVTSILKTLRDYQFDRKIENEPGRRAQYGLVNPRRSISFLTSKEERFTIDIGDNVPVGYSVYFSVDEDRLYSGPQYLVQSTDRKTIDFRDRKLAAFDVSNVIQMEYFVNAEKHIAIERGVAGKFEIKFPVQIEADHAVVEDFLDSIKNAEVKEFFDNPDKEFVKSYFSSGDSIKIEIEIKDENDIAIEFADVDGKFWVRKEDGSFGMLPDNHVRKLVKQLIDFRDRRLLKLEAGSVNEIQVNDVIYERIGGDFYTNSKDEQKRERDGAVYNLLMDIIYARADDIFSSGLSSVQSLVKSKPEFNILLKTNEAQIALKAWQSRADETTFIVALSDRPKEVYQVKKKIFGK